MAPAGKASIIKNAELKVLIKPGRSSLAFKNKPKKQKTKTAASDSDEHEIFIGNTFALGYFNAHRAKYGMMHYLYRVRLFHAYG